MGFLPGPGEQEPAQLLFDLMISQRRSPFLGHDDQVGGGQFGFVAAKKFPEQAFDAIALHRLPQAPAHRQSQPGAACGRGRQDQSEMARVEPLALGLRPQELSALAEPICLGETGGPFKVGIRTGAKHRQWLNGVRRRGSPPLRRRGACGPWPGGASRPGGRPGCSSVPRTRGCGPGANYWVDKCVLTFMHPSFRNLFQTLYKPFMVLFVKVLA
jgi:hypothetical protein